MPEKKWNPDAYEAEQHRRMRDARLRREAYDRQWDKKWLEERGRAIGERQYFSAAEIVERLALVPHTLVVDLELAARIGKDLVDYVQMGQFAVGDVADP